MFEFFRKKSEHLIDDDVSGFPEDRIIYNSRGLVPVIIQHAQTREVLHFGYMNRFALALSLKAKQVFLYRRSQKNVEKFGESELTYRIISIKMDKPRRSLLLKVQTTAEGLLRTSFIHKLFPKSKTSTMNLTLPG